MRIAAPVTVLSCLLAVGCGHKVAWQSDDATLSGVIHFPKGEGPFPAVVYVPGSGRLGHKDAMARSVAAVLTAEGFAVLVYDKRGMGSSTGDWRRENFADLARDAAGGVAMLRADPRIDRTRVGLVGHSQGGWVAPLAAEQPGGASFLILLSATPLTPLEQSVYVVETTLRQRGVDGSRLEHALRLVRMEYSAYLTNRGWEATRQAIDSARTEAWFDAGLLGMQPDTAWNVRWLRALPFDFDVRPSLARYRGPVLAVNGSDDPLVPGGRSRDAFQALAQARGIPITTLVIPGLRHGLGRTDRGKPDAAAWAAIVPWLRANIP